MNNPSSQDPFAPVLQNFRANVQRVAELMRFDEVVLGVAIGQLRRVRESQDTAKPRVENPRHRVDAVLKALEQIRENESLRHNYEVVNNQCLVLLVSYFAASLKDCYVAAVRFAIHTGLRDSFLREELKLNIGQLVDMQDDFSAELAQLLIDRKDLSFQDMKSTARAFEEVSGYMFERDSVVNDIVVAQACRHAIVHDGERITPRVLRSVERAIPRQLKQQLVLGETIRFVPGEVESVAERMTEYLARLSMGLQRNLIAEEDTPF